MQTNLSKIEIVVVVVLYNEIWENTPLAFSITQYLLNKNNMFNVELIIYDNSKVKQEISITDMDNVRYIHDSENGKLEAAYNYAFSVSKRKNIEWLLLLDQDMTIDQAFFELLYQKIIEVQFDARFVAIVPMVRSSGKLISPSIVNRFGNMKSLNNSDEIENKKLTAINSGTTLKTSFIKEVGGFNQNFKLDMLDHWCFNEIFIRNKKVCILNYILEHQLSVQNYNVNISPDRYKSIVESESVYYNNFCNILPKYFFKFKLFLRLIKQLLFVKNKKIACITVSTINSNIFSNKYTIE